MFAGAAAASLTYTFTTEEALTTFGSVQVLHKHATVDLTADTSGIVIDHSDPNDTVYQLTGAVSITIDGLGSFILSDPTEMDLDRHTVRFFDPLTKDRDFIILPISFAGPQFNFHQYDLQSALSPVMGYQEAGGNSLNTTAGVLDFYANGFGTFSTAVNPVPEPVESGAAIACLLAAGAVARGRRRRVGHVPVEPKPLVPRRESLISDSSHSTAS